jgi:hypothetical protein
VTLLRFVIKNDSVKQRAMFFCQKIKDYLRMRNTFGDTVLLEDQVRVFEGSQLDIALGKAKLVFASKGHIVNYGLIAIVNLLASQSITYLPSYNFGTTMDKAYIRVGTGTDITTGATTGLSSAVATAASSQAGVTSNPSGSYRIAWTATWNAGTLSAIDISELGLFLNIIGSTPLNTLQPFATGLGTQNTAAMFSRLSNADGDFSTFTVNTSVPLTIEWRLTLTFA